MKNSSVIFRMSADLTISFITLGLIHFLNGRGQNILKILYPRPKNFHGWGHHFVRISIAVINNDGICTFGKNSIDVVINVSNMHDIMSTILKHFQFLSHG